MKLLVENQGKPAHVVQEKKAIYLEGQMLSSKPNHNKRIYPQHVLDESVGSIEDRIRNNSFYGGITHDAEGSVALDRASHIVTSLIKRSDGYYGRARILTGTPAGNILESIAIHHKGKIGFSSRGYAGVKKVGDLMEVQSPYTLAAIDTVSSPSGKDCWAHVIHENIKTKTYNLCEAQLGLQILQEMAPKGNSLADYSRSSADAGAYGFSYEYGSDSRTYLERSIADTNDIIRKIGELQNRPDWQQDAEQDAANLRTYIANVRDPFERQKLYNALGTAMGFNKMKSRASEFLSRWAKFNR
jgi:hypothetical protein